MNYIVRADYYPDGQVVPLGITDAEGNTQYLEKTICVKRFGGSGFSFDCITTCKKRIKLSFLEGKWIIEIQN